MSEAESAALLTCPWCGKEVATQKDTGLLPHKRGRFGRRCEGSWRWPSEHAKASPDASAPE